MGMVRPAALITWATFLISVAASPAQTSVLPVTLSDTEKRTITSSKIGQRYDLLISLPENYTNSNQSYPVLYVLDGWHFPLMAFLQENNIYSKRMPAVIIVNVSHGEMDAMMLRTRDFTPTRTTEAANSGGAPAFLDFLERELIPFIDHTYRTNTSDRGLLGHSLGGLFAIYALEQRPALFQRIVAVSPALSWDNGRMLTEARRALRSMSSPVRLDLSVGSADEFGFAKPTATFARILGHAKPAGLDYRFTVYQGENHNSVRTLSFPAGLYWVYRPAK
jgi:predicted alpha/beta superfamily hydrolase